MHDDLFDFFYEAIPGYEEVGPPAHPARLLGSACRIPKCRNFGYRNMTDWGRAMYVTPGVVVDGKLVTNDLVKINLGIRILLGKLLLRGLGTASEMFVTHDPARQSGGQAPSLEPAHHSRNRRSASSASAIAG